MTMSCFVARFGSWWLALEGIRWSPSVSSRKFPGWRGSSYRCSSAASGFPRSRRSARWHWGWTWRPLSFWRGSPRFTRLSTWPGTGGCGKGARPRSTSGIRRAEELFRGGRDFLLNVLIWNSQKPTFQNKTSEKPEFGEILPFHVYIMQKICQEWPFFDNSFWHRFCFYSGEQK